MAFMSALMPCCICGKVFAFNPELVPSVRVLKGKIDPKGEKQGICKECVSAINKKRKEKGLEPFKVPKGAYDPQEVP